MKKQINLYIYIYTQWRRHTFIVQLLYYEASSYVIQLGPTISNQIKSNLFASTKYKGKTVEKPYVFQLF